MNRRFRDRRDAGRQLARRLAGLTLRDPVVLGLPRGGIPVAVEVGARLGAPVEVFVARKVGAPGHEELGIGAVAEGLDHVVAAGGAVGLGVDQTRLDELAQRSRGELARRVRAYRGDRPLPALTGRDVIVVDDGLATGVTAEAALRALKPYRPQRLVLGVPAGAREAVERLMGLADDVICVLAPEAFVAVGEWYEDFRQVSDDDVTRLLANNHERSGV